jgi:hypothetical protein
MKNLPRFSYKEKNAAYLFFKENGCVIFRDALDLKLIDAMKRELQAVIQQQVRKHLRSCSEFLTGNGFDRGLLELGKSNDLLRRRLYDVIQGLTSLYQFGFSSPFLAIAKDLGVEIPILRVTQFRMDLPEDERFLIPPHQEIKGIRSPNLIFMITPLVDISEQKGAIQIAPGSHKLGPIVPSVEENVNYQFIPEEMYRDMYPIQQVPMVVGETLVMNMYTIHGSAPNTTQETRWQSIIRFEDAAHLPYLDGDDSLQKFDIKG